MRNVFHGCLQRFFFFFIEVKFQLGALLHECIERLRDFSPRCEYREEAALSTLRLLDVCVQLHVPFTDAIRATHSSIMVASLDSLFLNVVLGHPDVTHVAAVAAYLTQVLIFNCLSRNER